MMIEPSSTVKKLMSEWKDWLASCGGDRSIAESGWYNHLVSLGWIDDYKREVLVNKFDPTEKPKSFRMLRVETNHV